MRGLVLSLLLAVPALAQTDPVEALSAALSLSADQADLAAEVFDARDPGSVWTLAAELAPTLSEAQRAALFARPARPEGGERDGRRAGAEGEPGRGERSRGERPGRDAAQVAVARAARDAALGLDADASAALDAALGGLSRRERMEAAREGALPEAVAAVLTDAQADLYRVQAALARHLRRAARPAR